MKKYFEIFRNSVYFKIIKLLFIAIVLLCLVSLSFLLMNKASDVAFISGLVLFILTIVFPVVKIFKNKAE